MQNYGEISSQVGGQCKMIQGTCRASVQRLISGSIQPVQARGASLYQRLIHLGVIRLAEEAPEHGGDLAAKAPMFESNTRILSGTDA